MHLEVNWSVSGTTEIELTDQDLAAAKAAGVDMWDQFEVADWFRANRKDLFGPDMVDDFSEREPVEIEEVMAYGEPDDEADQ